MPTEPLPTSESLIFDGTVSAPAAVALGLLLSFVVAWLLWREQQTLGAQWAGLFWLLRMTAIGFALWMLVGPMRETIRRSTITQSIAILADMSESMETVDPPDPIDSLRWTLASETEPTMLGLCDSAKVAVNMAQTACERASQYLRQHRPLKQIKQAVNQTRLGTQRAAEHCHELIKQLNDHHKDFVDRTERVETLLQGPITTVLDDIQDTVEESSKSQVRKLTDYLEVLNGNLFGLSRRLEVLTRDLARVLLEKDGALGSEAYELTRREKTVQVLDAMNDLLDGLADKVRIRKFHFDSLLTPVVAQQSWSDLTVPPQHQGTDISAILKRLASDRVTESTRLAIVLSDGNHTSLSGQAPQEIANEISDLPIYTVPVGNTTLVRDLRLHHVEAPATVVEKDSGVIEAIVTATDCDGLSTAITLRHDGQEIDRQTVAFAGDRIDRRVQFNVPANQVGWQDYELTAEPLENEHGITNNVAAISWEVVRDKLRVLLADGVSHWEFRYLQQLFRRDSHVECDELLFYPRLRGTGEMATNPRLPERVDDWSVYDIVILGDLGAKQFNTASQESLAEYVRKHHGHLILLAGRDHMPREYHGKPFMDLLPVTAASQDNEDQGYTLMLTDEGRLHSALAIEDSNRASEAAWLNVYRKMPIFKLSEYSSPKPTARTLLRAVPTRMSVVVDNQATREDLPAFLCWHQVGGGKVVYLAAAEIWKLRFRAEDRRHHRFWGQLLRWITADNLGSGTDLLRLSTDKTRYNRLESIEVTLWLKDQTGRPLAEQSLQAVVRTLDDEVATAELTSDPEVAGRYFCNLESLPAGAYEIVVQGSVVDELLSSTANKSPIRAMITIEAGDNLEMLDTCCDRALLEQVADLTGGQVVPPTAIAEVLQLASLSPEVNETSKRTPLWNRWAYLWIVLGCLVVEWIVRKQKGLV